MEVEEKNKFISFLVWFCVTLFYCYQYVLRVLPNIIMPEMMSKYSVGASEFGSFVGIYYMGYIVVHIPIGILLTRFGGRTVLPLCIALTSLGLIPLAYMNIWDSVVIGRVITGIGSSAAIVGALQIFRILFPASFTRMLGFTVFFGLITAVYVSVPLAGVIKNIGIDATISILLYSGIALAVLTYFLMPKSVAEASHSDIWTDVKAVLCNYKLLITAFLAGLMIGPLEGFADAWGSAYIMSVYGIEKSIADSITLSVLLGMCVGCFVLPYIADKTRMYLGVTIFAGIGMILCFVHILSGDANVNTLYYACSITGVFCAYQVIIIAKMATFVSEERSGMAAAVANMIIMAFGWVFHNAIGRRLDSLWAGQTLDGVRVYDADAFVTSISIIPAATSIAVIGFMIFVITNIIRARLMRKNGQSSA